MAKRLPNTREEWIGVLVDCYPNADQNEARALIDIATETWKIGGFGIFYRSVVSETARVAKERGGVSRERGMEQLRDDLRLYLDMAKSRARGYFDEGLEHFTKGGSTDSGWRNHPRGNGKAI